MPQKKGTVLGAAQLLFDSEPQARVGSKSCFTCSLARLFWTGYHPDRENRYILKIVWPPPYPYPSNFEKSQRFSVTYYSSTSKNLVKSRETFFKLGF